MATLPTLNAPVLHTVNGTPYLQLPGVVCLSAPNVNLNGLKPFLEGFDPELQFSTYLEDPTAVDPATNLIMMAGQSCYQSFAAGKHTPRAQAQKYVDNILEQRHGSVLEHANFTLFLYGISRSLTHELVRHRAGFAYSQLSQRYVYGSRMRFVERPEFIHQPKLHALFEAQIDQFAKLYEETATSLLSLQEEGQDKLLTPEAKTDQRKAVNQTARTFLPNCTETQIVVTANVRAWRHFLEMRGSIHAETEIRMLSGRILTVLQELAPTLFADFLVSEVAGLPVLKSAHLKA